MTAAHRCCLLAERNARVVVCDLDEARARTIGERYGASRATTDLASVLADPSIVAVSIATPDHARAIDEHVDGVGPRHQRCYARVVADV